MNLRIVLAIFWKDFLDAIRNAYILVSLILPIGMSLLFGFFLPGGGQVTRLTVAVYDPGRSQLVIDLKSESILGVEEADTADKVEEMVRTGTQVGLVLPDDFDAQLMAGGEPALQFYFSSRQNTGSQAAVRQVVERLLRQEAGQTPPARFEIYDLAEGAAPFNYSRYLVTLFLAMSLIVTGVYVVPAILVEEKEKHTLEAVLVSPASHADLVAGKALVGMAYSLASAMALLLLNDGLSGNPVVTLSAVALGALFLVLCGLFLGSLFRTMMQVNSWSTLLMILLLLPAMFSMLPPPVGLLAALAAVIPTGRMSEAISLGLSGQPTTAALPHLAILAGCAALMFLAVVAMLQRERR